MKSFQTLVFQILGVIAFRAQAFRQIAEDANATTTAILIVALFGFMQVSDFLTYPPRTLTISLGASAIAVLFFEPILFWIVRAWLTCQVAQRAFHAVTSTPKMLRTSGFAQIWFVPLGINYYRFQISSPWSGLLGCGLVIIAFLGALSVLIATREATGLSTNRAIVTTVLVVILTLPLIGANGLLLRSLGL